jgi:circadian clock protein KaiC
MALRKSPVGISGLDEVTGGGLPHDRISLVCGETGTGKSLLAMEFLVNGITKYGEAGLLMSFEETAAELAEDTRSLGWDLPGLVERGQLAIDYIRVDRSQLTVAGEYDLEALFVRLGHGIEAVGAQRVVLDSIEALFGAFGDDALLRHELHRLFGWLKARGVTTIVTAESVAGQLTRQGLEEFVSDCVILLDHRIRDETSTRRMRIVKYRGSDHGSDEYPFTIDADGLAVFPLSSLPRSIGASSERVSTGVERLDEMVGGGFFRGSTVLVSGSPGAGKTTLGAAFAVATCLRGERCVYFTMEESPQQLIRNMGSVAMDLGSLVRDGTLTIVPRRTKQSGLEEHLVAIHKEVLAAQPTTVILDPLSAFAGQPFEIAGMLSRIIDFLRLLGVTVLLTSLVHEQDFGPIGISSLADSWIALTNRERDGERNRGITVVKSRGTAQSNQVREFVLSGAGIDIVDAYAGEDELLMGNRRTEAEARERAARLRRQESLATLQRRSLARTAALRAQIAALEAEIEADTVAAEIGTNVDAARETQLDDDAHDRASARGSQPGADMPRT